MSFRSLARCLLAASVTLSVPCTGAAQEVSEFDRMIREARRERERLVAKGEALFGRSPHWSDDEYAAYGGTLRFASPQDWSVGDWGCPLVRFTAIQKVSQDECLVYAGDQPVLLRGLDMSKVHDGAEFLLLHPVAIDRTHDYTSYLGIGRTVLVLDASATGLAERAEEHRKVMAEVAKAVAAAAKAAEYRTVTDVSGQHKVRAKFYRLLNREVTLELEDGNKIEVPVGRLSDQDQKWVLTQHANWRRSTAAAAPAPRSASRKAYNPFAVASDPAVDNSEIAAPTVLAPPPGPADSKMTEVASATSGTETKVAQNEPQKDPTTVSSKELPAVVPRRWLGTTYDSTIQHVEGDNWIEVDNKTGEQKWALKQTGRGEDYVELFNAERDQKWRMYGDRMTFFKNGKWEWIANGHWIVEPSER